MTHNQRHQPVHHPTMTQTIAETHTTNPYTTRP